MTKRLANPNTFIIVKNGRRHIVLLERIGNTYYGNPRYEARIIFDGMEGIKDYLYSVKYRFIGHYCGDYGEAEFIVNYYYEEKEKRGA